MQLNKNITKKNFPYVDRLIILRNLHLEENNVLWPKKVTSMRNA